MTNPSKFVPASPGFNIDFLAWDTPEKPLTLSPTTLRDPTMYQTRSAAPPGGVMLSHERTALMDFYSHSAFKSLGSDGTQHPLDLSQSVGNQSLPSFFSPPTPKSSLLTSVPLMYSAGPIGSLYGSVFLHRLQSNPMFYDLQRLLVAECENYRVPTNLLKMSSPWVGVPHSTTKFDLGNQVFSRHTKIQNRMTKLREDLTYRRDISKLSSYYSSEVGTIEVARYQALCAASVSEHATQAVHNCFDERRLKLMNHIHSEINLLLQQHRRDGSICSVDSSPDNDSFDSHDGPSSSNNSPDLESLLNCGRDVQQSTQCQRSIPDVAQQMGTTARQLRFGDTVITKETRDVISPELCRPLSPVSCVSTFSSDSDIDVCDFSDRESIFGTQTRTTSPDLSSFTVSKMTNFCTSDVSIQHHNMIMRRSVSAQQNSTSVFLMDQVQNDLKCRGDVSGLQSDVPPCDSSVDIVAIATAELDLPTSGPITDKLESDHELFIDELDIKCEVSSTTGQSPPMELPQLPPMIGRNRCLTPEATMILTRWYEAHINYPYPNDPEVQQLCVACGLSKTQVKKWMANKRVRTYNTLSITGNQHPIKLKFKREGSTAVSGKPIYQQLSKEARDILNQWYDTHAENPYPSEDEKVELSHTANITLSQVRSWFANKRSRAHNTRRQIPNYFIKKYPEYSPVVHMVSVHREEARRGGRRQRTHNANVYAPY